MKDEDKKLVLEKMDTSEILYNLSKEMDAEYEKIVLIQNERRILHGPAHHNDPIVQQDEGRLQILAQWACRLRAEGGKYESLGTATAKTK